MRRSYICLLLSLLSVQARADALDDLIDRAALNHPSVSSRRALMSSAESDVLTAKLSFLPTPSINTQRVHAQYSGLAASNGQVTTLSITQPLWMGGALTAGLDRSRANLSAAECSLLETMETVGTQVTNAYADWTAAAEKVRALKNSVAMHVRLLGLIQRRAESGVSAPVDRELAMARLAQARSDLSTYRATESAAISTLTNLLGQPITSEELLAHAQDVQSDETFSGDLVTRALDRSPTMQRIRLEADSAEASARVVKAQAYPQVQLQAQRQIGNATIPNQPSINYFGIVVTMAPGGGLSSISSGRAADQRYQSTLDQIDAASRELTTRITKDVIDLESARRREQDLQQTLKLNKDISASYDRLFLVGKRSWIDVMNALRERSQAEVQLADTQGQILATSRRLNIYVNGLGRAESPAVSSEQ